MAKVPGSIRDEVFVTGYFKKNKKGCDAIKALSQKGFLNVLEEDKGIFFSKFIVFQPDLLEEWAHEVYFKLQNAGVKRHMLKTASFWFNSGSNFTEPEAENLIARIRNVITEYDNVNYTLFESSLAGNVNGHQVVATSGFGVNGTITSISYKSAKKIRESVEQILGEKTTVSEINIDF